MIPQNWGCSFPILDLEPRMVANGEGVHCLLHCTETSKINGEYTYIYLITQIAPIALPHVAGLYRQNDWVPIVATSICPSGPVANESGFQGSAHDANVDELDSALQAREQIVCVYEVPPDRRSTPL